MTARSGTPAWWASTTAGCSSAAAVPLVVTTTAGQPRARPMPRARKPADRSSSTTWRRSRPSAAKATISGVERDPGATTASVTPPRTHSSTRVAAKAAWTSAAPVMPGSIRAGRRGAGNEGRPWSLVHGFTQTRRSWRPIAERLAPDHHFTLVDAPGHGGSAEVRADLWQGAALLGQTGRTGRLRRLLHGCPAVPPPGPAAPGPGDLAGAGRWPPGHRCRCRCRWQWRARRGRVDRRAAGAREVGRREADGVAGFVDWWLRPAPVLHPRPRCTRAATIG